MSGKSVKTTRAQTPEAKAPEVVAPAPVVQPQGNAAVAEQVARETAAPETAAIAGVESGEGVSTAPNPAPTGEGKSTSEDAAKATPGNDGSLGEGLFYRGTRGDTVKAIQELVGGIEVDGKFGPITSAAVKRFQKQHGLKVDGIVGPETRGALYGIQAARRSAQRQAGRTAPASQSRAPAAPTAPAERAPTAESRTETAPATETPTTETSRAVEPEAPAAETPVSVRRAQPVEREEPKPSDQGPAQQDEATRETGAPRDTSDVDRLLRTGFSGKTLGRDARGADAKTLQGTLRALGYLPEDAKLSGRMDAETTNALMAFQVATSGVDKVEKRTDSRGNPVYQTDRDKSRLQGIVTGKLDRATRAKLTEALKTERADRLAGKKEDRRSAMRTMGDNEQQRKQIADRMRKQGLDPEKLMNVDTSKFSKMGLRPHVLDAAIDAWENAYASGKTKNMTITVNDFELPSNMRRSFTLDLSKPDQGLKMHELMAHGRGSGDPTWSTKFSGAQRNGSNQSVLGGVMVGQRGYYGSMQYGATVDGLERGINDKASPRLIRMHAKKRGSLSESAIGRNLSYRSLGCMVMTDDAAKKYRNDARKEGGRYNFNFSPNEQYWGKKNAVNSD